MKYNYLLRPAVLCLAVLWLVLQTDLALAQVRANVTPIKTGGALSPAARNATVNLLSAADLIVSPSELSDTLNTNKQHTKQIVLENTGTDDLVFFAGTVPDYAAPQKISRVVVITEADTYTEQIPLIFSAPDIQLEFLPLHKLPALALSDLLPYDVVLLTNDYPYERVSGATAVHIGDVMADYVDAGGKVIMNNNAFGVGFYGIAGRFAAEQYSPVAHTDVSMYNPGGLGNVVRPDHPFMQGVSALSYKYAARHLSLAPGAIDIAYYGNGVLFLATNPNVAAINMSLLSPNHNGQVPWTGDVSRLYQNVVRYFRAASVMKVTPVRGTIAPGNQAVLNVAFDATALDSATYTASLQVYNITADSLSTVPLSLVVTGKEILFSPDTVKAELHKEQSITRSLTITNNGAAARTFGVTDVPPFVSVSPQSGSLAPGASATVSVSLSSAGLAYGTYRDAITLDIDGVAWEAPVSLYVYDVPVLSAPTGLHDTLRYKGQSIQTFQLQNTGGSPLSYAIQLVADSTGGDTTAVLAGVKLFSEDFDGSVFPPQGWSNPAVDARKWNWNTEYVYNNTFTYPNYVGTGRAAMVSEINGSGAWGTNASLISPAISIPAGFRHYQLAYNASFRENPGVDSLNLYVQTDNGPWILASAWANHTGPNGVAHITLSLDNYISPATTSIRLRWKYVAYVTIEAFHHAQIDDVVVTGERDQWLTIVPETGTIQPGASATLTAKFDAEDLAAGLHTAQVRITSNDPQQPVTIVPASLYVEESALAISESSIVQTVVVGDTVVRSIVLTNNGSGAVDYNLSGTSLVSAPAPGTVLYGTSFDEFANGNINGQHGWMGWPNGSTALSTVTTTGTGKAVYMLGEGMSVAIVRSPVVPVGTNDVTSMRMALIVSQGFHFELKTLSETGEWFVSVRYSSYNNALYVNDNQLTMPAFGNTLSVRIDGNRATQTFTVYIEGEPVYTGTKTYQEIQKLEMWAGGLYLDSFSISNGTGPEYTKSISPLSGVLQPGASATVALAFNPVNGEVGVYEDVIIIKSDTLATSFEIPVRLTVVQDSVAARPVIVTEETTAERFSLYPVPVAEELHISLSGVAQDRVRVVIHDHVGSVLYTAEGTVADFADRTVTAADAGLTTGFYYLRVEYANGKREVRKFMKK